MKAVKKTNATTIDEYIAGLGDLARSRVKELRALIRGIVPSDAVEVLSYGIPAFRTDRVLVWYAGFAKHCSLFPGASIIAKFQKELQDYQVSKGTVQFPLDKKLPSGLIKKLVKARVEEAISTSSRT